jgi:DNA helicase HerA-like ATPase
VIHRTFRSLDQPPKLVGFTIRQWGALIADTSLVLGVVYVAGLPVRAAITLIVFAVGLPAAVAYVSETGGIELGHLLRDLVHWRIGPRNLEPGAAKDSAAALLGVKAVRDDGLLVRDDGVLVRYLEVSPVNPLVLEPAQAERISAAFVQVAARLPDGQSLQLCAQATPLELEEILAVEMHRSEQAAGAAQDIGEHARAKSIRALGIAHERSIRHGAETVRPLRLRYLVVCPWRPAGRPSIAIWRRGRPPQSEAAHERAVRDSLSHSEGIRGDLEASGVTARPLDGPEVLDLLAERLDPEREANGGLPASFMSPEVVQHRAPGETPKEAEARARALAEAVCTAPISIDRDRLRIGEHLEQCFYVSHAPEQTWLGWLLHLMQTPRPFTISVHVQAPERYRERIAQKRRYKRIHGVNRGIEARGRPLDPDARVQEQEAAELNDELATSAGAGIYHVSVYGAISEPDGDTDALRELCQTAGRELTMACDARVQHGPFAQKALWQSTLPLGRDLARRRRKYVSRNVGDTFPLVGTSCGSPDGIPLGFALPGRTLERLDPFDPQHPNHLLLVNGMSGAGKTMAAIILLARAISQGATGFIIDRAGHFEFLASLIPGAVSVEIGGDAHAVNCWDVEDPARVGAEKIDYLLALHALLLGEHHAGRDSYGLTDLEANLLGLAIGEVYARCALTREEPRQLLLQEELERRYQQERQEGSVGIAEALRNLSMRLNNYVLDGPYSYLTDRPTTIPPGSPLVVFDTRSIPDAKAAAALFVICEHVKTRIASTRREHLAGDGPKHAWAGRSFLVVDEAWKLIERPATGRWFNEFCRRSRHYALWLIAISQQLSDFDNEHGKALLANAAMRLFLRQEARELTYVKDALKLTDEAIDAISSLRTVRGAYSTAYLMNGTRGQGTIQIGVGPWEYWIASSDPARDEPIRQRALRESGGDSWAALKLLVQEEWQEHLAAELEGAGQ